MFSSRTLADRNNDPFKGMCHCGTDVYAHGEGDNHSPVEVMREEFQYGVLPENPILALFRTCPGDKAEDWVWGIDNGHNDQATPAQIVHARRVLTLLSKLGSNQ